ncbi:SET and MYND domain-containing protein 4-like [Microplitis mediator]|uniref:SET and MYND domain-containing protein 4-like n=1 Tax=Microplitis mediator TaxID=375433 RepID=UPI002556A3E8|nr:SET and MYND domain-containing protein 4-like [Microplitis mediator]
MSSRIDDIFKNSEIVPLFKEINDEDRIHSIVGYFLSQSLPVIKDTKKDASKALEQINLANDSFKSVRSLYLVRMYTEAIMNAPMNSPEQARGFANRSAALCNARLFEDSLKDIDRVLAIGYPDNLKAGLYLRRAKNLLSLNQEMRPEVKEAIAEARRLMDKVDVCSEKKIDMALKKLRQKDSFNKSYTKWDAHRFLPPVPNDNPQIARASGGIAMKYNKEFGRHVVATRDIKAGETLMVARSYVSVIKREKIIKFCWYCLQRTWASIPCNECVNVVFCNEECRDKAWQEFHDIECPFLTAVGLERIVSGDLLGIKMTIKALKEAGSLEELEKKVEALDAIPDKINNCRYNNVYDDTRYESVCTMYREGRSDLSAVRDLIRSVELLYYLIKSTKMFGDKISDLSETRSNKWITFMVELIFRHQEISQMNATELRIRKAADDAPIRSYILIPLYGFLNHNCDPNIHKLTSGDMNALFAVRFIKKGEQIFMNYGARFQMMDKRSRMIYLERHRFLCRCIPCSKNWGPNSSLPSFIDQSLPAEVKEKLQIIDKKAKRYLLKLEKESPNLDRFETPDSYFRDRISRLSQFLNDYGELAQYPCQEIEDCKQALIVSYKFIDDHYI